MNDEKVLGAIPRVWIAGAGTNEYAIFVSTKRLILAIKRQDYSMLGVALGGAIGGAIGYAITKSKGMKDYDYSVLKANQILNQDKKNRGFSYANITKVEFKKYWKFPYGLSIWGLKKGLTKKMKQKKLIEWHLVPPGDYSKDKKSQGLSKKEVIKEYAIDCQKLLSSVLKYKIVKGVE